MGAGASSFSRTARRGEPSVPSRRVRGMTVPGFPRRFAPLVSAAFLMVVIATCGSAPTAHPDPTISVKPPPCAASYVINNGQLTVTVTSTGPAQVEVRVDAAELPRQVHTS